MKTWRQEEIKDEKTGKTKKVYTYKNEEPIEYIENVLTSREIKFLYHEEFNLFEIFQDSGRIFEYGPNGFWSSEHVYNQYKASMPKIYSSRGIVDFLERFFFKNEYQTGQNPQETPANSFNFEI
jgi:hypothetical protein